MLRQHQKLFETNMSVWGDICTENERKQRARAQLRELYDSVYRDRPNDRKDNVVEFMEPDRSSRIVNSGAAGTENRDWSSRTDGTPPFANVNPTVFGEFDLSMWHWPASFAWPESPSFYEEQLKAANLRAERRKEKGLDRDVLDYIPVLTGYCKHRDWKYLHRRNKSGGYSREHTDKCYNIIDKSTYLHYKYGNRGKGYADVPGIIWEQFPIIERHHAIEEAILKDMDPLLPRCWGTLWNRAGLTMSHRYRLMFHHVSRQLTENNQDVTSTYPTTRFTICCACGGVRQYCNCASWSECERDRFRGPKFDRGPSTFGSKEYNRYFS